MHMHRIRNAFSYTRDLGVHAAWALVWRNRHSDRLIRMRIWGLSMAFECRNTSEDIAVVRNVLGRRDSLVELKSPTLIIDAGAHIGTSAAIYASRFPSATVLAVEPDARNFTLLQSNMSGRPNVHCVRAALWCKDETVQIANPDAVSDSFQVTAGGGSPGTEVPGYSLRTLLTMENSNHCDLLKLDIEGAEWELMRDTPAEVWLSIHVLVVELHEQLRPGVIALAARTFPRERWDWSRRGEYVVLRQIP